jgi:aerobic carbon-monoxide dehydrogenase small subunit
MPAKNISFTLNGETKDVFANPGEMLVDVLRDKLGLTGTKIGCRTSSCGACTVIVDGLAVNSCLTPIGKVAGAAVETIEGVAEQGKLHPVQQSLTEKGGVQCGFCTPGIVMSSKVLLNQNPNPDSADIRTALSGNLCRCTGYIKVEEAVVNAAAAIRGKEA